GTGFGLRHPARRDPRRCGPPGEALMTIHPPSSDELRALARERGLDLSESELEVYRNLIAGSLGAFAALDAEPAALPALPADRHWWEPRAEDNPHGAWYVRCAIRTRADGPRPRAGAG